MNDESKSRFIPKLWKFISQRWAQIYFDSVDMATKGVFVSFEMDCECISTNNMHLGLNMNFFKNPIHHFIFYPLHSRSLQIRDYENKWVAIYFHLLAVFDLFSVAHAEIPTTITKILWIGWMLMNMFSFFCFNTPLFQLLRKRIGSTALLKPFSKTHVHKAVHSEQIYFNLFRSRLQKTLHSGNTAAVEVFMKI